MIGIYLEKNLENKLFSLFSEVYRRPPGANGDNLQSIYTSLYDPDRSKSNANPNVYFYKTAGYPTGFIY